MDEDFDALDAILNKKKKIAKKKAEKKFEEENLFAAPVQTLAEAATIVTVVTKTAVKDPKMEWAKRPKSEEEIRLEQKLLEEAAAAAALPPASPTEPKKFVGRGQSGATGKIAGKGEENVVDMSKFISLDDLGKEPEAPAAAEASPTTANEGSAQESPTASGAYVARRAGTGAFPKDYAKAGTGSPPAPGAPAFAKTSPASQGVSPTSTGATEAAAATTSSGAAKWAPKPRSPVASGAPAEVTAALPKTRSPNAYVPRTDGPAKTMATAPIAEKETSRAPEGTEATVETAAAPAPSEASKPVNPNAYVPRTTGPARAMPTPAAEKEPTAGTTSSGVAKWVPKPRSPVASGAPAEATAPPQKASAYVPRTDGPAKVVAEKEKPLAASTPAPKRSANAYVPPSSRN